MTNIRSIGVFSSLLVPVKEHITLVTYMLLYLRCIVHFPLEAKVPLVIYRLSLRRM